MNSKNNIVFISDDLSVSQNLTPKLILLREVDSITESNFEQAVEKISTVLPEAIFIYAQDEEKTVNLIHEIRLLSDTKKTPMLLVLKDYNQNLLLNAYEEGINDYLYSNSDDAEILIKTIWALKRQETFSETETYKKLLSQLKVLDTDTGFYGDKFYKQVFENEFDKIHQKNIEAMFLAIAPSEVSQTEIKYTELAKAIRRSVRNSDVVATVNKNKIYILLFKTDLKGAFIVWDRIKSALGEDYGVGAGVAAIEDKSFEKVEGEVINALCEAVSTKNDLIVVEKTEPQDNWIDKINSNQKNFKLFKQAFTKKLEKVITPVFFQVQKSWEEKLFETVVDQYSNASQSIFSLSNDNAQSELKITYPGFSKLNVDIVHKGLDSPENRRISIDLTEVDEKTLTKLLEDFIEEFKTFSAS